MRIRAAHRARGRAPAGARQARRAGRARRQRAVLRRDRGAARARARTRRSSSCTGSTATPAACCSWRASRAALRTLHALLREGAVQKSYLALVVGRWDLGAQAHRCAAAHRRARSAASARCAWRERRQGARDAIRAGAALWPHASLIEATLETGRTHQIRVHAAHAGHPVAGDEKYGDARLQRDAARARTHAHVPARAQRRFQWPQGGEFSLNAPLPAELGAVLDQLSGRKENRSLRARGGRRFAGRPRAR